MGEMLSKEVSEVLGVSVDTVRRLAESGEIKFYRTRGQHRRYDRDSVYKYRDKINVCSARKVIIYTRVLNDKSLGEGKEQEDVLKLFCAAKGWTFTIIRDIGTADSMSREGLLKLIELVECNLVDKIVVKYTDSIVSKDQKNFFDVICKHHAVDVITVSEDEALGG